MRVVVLTQVPEVALGYSATAAALGHEVPAVIVALPTTHPLEKFVELTPEKTDVVFPRSKRSLAPLLRAYEPDVGLCTAFPWLVPQEAIDVPRLGIVNGHPTMLPKGRGPHPFAWAVRNGETEMGFTYHYMDATFDTGNVLAQLPIPFDADEETMESLIPKLDAAARELLPQVFAKLEAGDPGTPQEGGNYEDRFEPEYAVLDTSSAAAAHRQVRAWSFVSETYRVGPLHDGRRVLRTSMTEVEGAERVECADGPLWIVETVTSEPTR